MNNLEKIVNDFLKKETRNLYDFYQGDDKNHHLAGIDRQSVLVSLDLLQNWGQYPESQFEKFKTFGDLLLEKIPENYRPVALLIVLNVAIRKDHVDLVRWCQEKGLNENFELTFKKLSNLTPSTSISLTKNYWWRNREDQEPEQDQGGLALIVKGRQDLNDRLSDLKLFNVNTDEVFTSKCLFLNALKESISNKSFKVTQLLIQEPYVKKILKGLENDLMESQTVLGDDYWVWAQHLQTNLNPWVALYEKMNDYEPQEVKAFQDLLIKEDVPLLKGCKVFEVILLNTMINEAFKALDVPDQISQSSWSQWVKYFEGLKTPGALKDNDLKKYGWFTQVSEAFKEKKMRNRCLDMEEMISIWVYLINPDENNMLHEMSYGGEWTSDRWKKCEEILNEAGKLFHLNLKPIWMKVVLNEVFQRFHENLNYGSVRESLVELESELKNFKNIETYGWIKESINDEDFKEWYNQVVNHAKKRFEKKDWGNAKKSDELQSMLNWVSMSLSEIKMNETDWVQGVAGKKRMRL